jgi:ABC-type lipoprotein export system ATPase subunit
VELPLLYAGVRKSERQRRSLAVLEEVGLSNRIAHWPTQLSGGEQQRVAVARALVTDPALIIADEPTGALDSHTGMEILALLQRLHQSGRTMVLVTHDAAVAQHASRVIKLQDGRIIDDARLRASFRSRIEPADHHVRAAAVSA